MSKEEQIQLLRKETGASLAECIRIVNMTPTGTLEDWKEDLRRFGEWSKLAEIATPEEWLRIYKAYNETIANENAIISYEQEKYHKLQEQYKIMVKHFTGLLESKNKEGGLNG